MSAARVISSLAAGVFLVNAIPHGVSGVQGREFPSPFSNPPGRAPSSPAANVVWSAANTAAGVALLRRRMTKIERTAFAGGALAMAFVLAGFFGKPVSAEAGAQSQDHLAPVP